MENQKIKCNKCKSSNTLKRGVRITEFRGKLQRFFCKDCKTSFTINDGFFRMRNSSKKITKAIDLYFSALSSRKVRNNFKRHDEIKISHNSILTWCRKYSQLVNKYVGAT